jgi:hypothetical protein
LELSAGAKAESKLGLSTPTDASGMLESKALENVRRVNAIGKPPEFVERVCGGSLCDFTCQVPQDAFQLQVQPCGLVATWPSIKSS